MTEVVLSWFELFQAGVVGVMRQIEALKKGRPDRYGYDGDGWSVHICGAAAEMAVAKAEDHYWESVVSDPAKLGGDVGPHQIRWTKHPEGHLLVHPSDRDDAHFFLVTGQPPRLRIVGSMLGSEAKQKEWWRDPGTGRPAFFVPQEALQ